MEDSLGKLAPCTKNSGTLQEKVPAIFGSQKTIPESYRIPDFLKHFFV